MKIRQMLTAALAASTLLAGNASPQAPAPEAVLKLEPYRKGVAVRVVANGKPGLFTFDTAGGVSVVSPTFAKAAGCTPWGELVGHQMTGNKLSGPRCDDFRFSIGGYQLTAPHALVFDVAPLMAKDAEPFEGLLALDAFAGKTITVDMAAGELIVETSQSAAARIIGARELPITIGRELSGRALAVYVRVPTAKGPLNFEIDSGNGGTILVSKPYAELMGLDPKAEGPQRGAFDVAPGIRAEGLMFTPDLILDGNLGMPFLKDYAFTLDLAAGRMWIKRSRATPPKGMGESPVLPKG